VCDIKRSFQSRISVRRGKTGKLIAAEKQILIRWIQYFEERLNNNPMQTPNSEIFLFSPELYTPVHPVSEMCGVIRRMK
jgi:hypothetical protein